MTKGGARSMPAARTRHFADTVEQRVPAGTKHWRKANGVEQWVR